MDRQFKIKMDEIGSRLRVYKRNVDDINVVVNAPKAGLKFVESEGKIVEDGSAADQERDVKADRRCMACPDDWQQHSTPVYGASASDLNAVQCFLKRCHKR